MKPNVKETRGITLAGAVFLIFLTLKLCGQITWSWWWVTAPLWVPFMAVIGGLLAFLAVIGLIAGGVWVYEKVAGK